MIQLDIQSWSQMSGIRLQLHPKTSNSATLVLSTNETKKACTLVLGRHGCTAVLKNTVFEMIYEDASKHRSGFN